MGLGRSTSPLRLALAVAIASTVGACGHVAPASSPSASATQNAARGPDAAVSTPPGCTVGVAWFDYRAARWAMWDEPAIKAALDAGGARYIASDARSSAQAQLGDIASLAAEGAQVVIVASPGSDTALRADVAAAQRAALGVIVYEAPADVPGTVRIAYDNVAAGRVQAAALLKAAAPTALAIIKGAQDDPVADQIRQGYTDAGIPPAGAPPASVRVVGEVYTPDWDPAAAQGEMRQILAAGDGPTAVLAENDALAGGVVAALPAGARPGVSVAGAGADLDGLRRVALGTQVVDTWPDPRRLGAAAGAAALRLCRERGRLPAASPSPLPGAVSSDTSVLLEPTVVTQSSLKAVLDAGWVQRADLCAGVPAEFGTPCG